MIKGMIGPKDAHIVISRTCDRGSLQSKMDFADVIKALEMGKAPWIIWMGLMESQGSLQGKEGTGGSGSGDAR